MNYLYSNLCNVYNDAIREILYDLKEEPMSNVEYSKLSVELHDKIVDRLRDKREILKEVRREILKYKKRLG